MSKLKALSRANTTVSELHGSSWRRRFRRAVAKKLWTRGTHRGTARALMCGYGDVGKPCVFALRGSGAHVFVAECAPSHSLQACFKSVQASCRGCGTSNSAPPSMSSSATTIIFPIADGRIKTSGGDQDLRTSTLVRHRPIQGESNIDFRGEAEGSLPQSHDSFPDAGEAINDFWSMSGSFIYRHHVEPRVKLYSPREESFPIPLKYIDVTRTTHTNLDVKQEKRIDDYWNIDGSRDLSDPWTGFTQFTLLDEKAPDGYTWSGGRLTRKQLTSRPDHLWPELWKSMGKNAKLKEKQKWSEEKIHLENARKLRGIYFIDPEDKEFKETIKNARKKLETSVAPATPCKIMKNCGSGGSDKNKTKLEADESTRMRMGNPTPSNQEDHIAGKGENSLQHYNLVHKFIPMTQAMKIPAAKAAVDKEWEKLEKISAWNLTKVKSKKQVIDEARTAGVTVHFASLLDICHLKLNWRQNTKNSKVELFSAVIL